MSEVFLDVTAQKFEQPSGNYLRSVRAGRFIGAQLALLTAFGIALVWICVKSNQTFFHDDAFITLRYVRHLLSGYGPVWNTSGARVEGYTSLLHVLLISLVAKTGMPLPTAARTVNIASHVGLLLVVGRYLRRRTGIYGAALGVLILAASWTLIVWDLGGLEIVLYSLLVAAGVLTAVGYFDSDTQSTAQSAYAGSLLLALAALTRPEGALLLLGFWLFIAIDLRRSSRGRWQYLAGAVLVGLLALLPSVLFRWMFFHAVFPNTFYAKMGGVDRRELLYFGKNYLFAFLTAAPYLGLMAGLAALYAWKKRLFRTQDAVLWGFAGIIMLFILISGGDHMPAFRFCAPLIPLFTVVLAEHLKQVGLLEGRRSTLAVVVIMAFALLKQRHDWQINPRRMDTAAEVGGVVGKYIQTHWKEGSTIALNTAGSTPYFADGMQYIDMLGLNDAVIARRKNVPRNGPWIRVIGHLKGDGLNVLSRKPDYIILGPAEGVSANGQGKVFFVGDYEIANSAEFKTHYESCVVPMPNGMKFTYFQRIDLRLMCQEF